MIRLDTIHLEVPIGAVRGVDRSAFDTTYHNVDEESGTYTKGQKLKSDYKPIGCAGITYKEGASYQVKISAKTLGQDYLQGINKNTIEQALTSLSDVIDIDTQKLIDINPQMYALDVTDNISLEDVGGTKREIVQSLMSVKMNDRFLSIPYDKKSEFGIEFRGTQKEKNRINIYDKYLDLQKSANKDFIKHLPNPLHVYNQAQQTIRIESNHSKFKSIRDRLNISDNSLCSILNSTAPVNHDVLIKVMNYRKDKQLDIFEEYKKMNLQGDDYVRLKGIQTIIRECNYDSKLSKEFFKFIYGKNFKYHYYKSGTSIRQLIRQAQVDRVGESDSVVLTITDRLLDVLKKTA